MKPLLALQATPGRRAAAMCFVSLALMSGSVLAQTTGTVNPNSAPAEAAKEDAPPPGGCMPIGLTASGEIVFPIQCKEFIERARGKTVQQSAVPEEKPAAAQPEAVVPESNKQPEAVAPESNKLADKPAETADKPSETAVKPAERNAAPVRVERKRGGHPKKSDDCTHYKTYDRASGTYRGYDGQRRSCLGRES